MGIKKKKKVKDPYNATMSLGDHLEELRLRLILAILGLVVGTIVCLFFGRRIIQFIEQPYNKIMQKRAIEEAEESQNSLIYLFDKFFSNLTKKLNSDPNAPDIDPNTVTFVQNIYADTVTKIIEDPNYTNAVISGSKTQDKLVVLSPADPIIGFMKISLISGLILSSPWVFYQLWMFIAAGLYAHERRYVKIAVPFSTTLFVIGALFFLFVVAPISLKFFLTFGEYLGLSSYWTFQRYVSFVTMLMLVFGLGFQTPIVIFVLNRIGLVSIKGLKKSRRYVCVGMFALAAIVTPPDIISQITLAMPLYALFELGILLSWLSERKAKLSKEKNKS